MPLIADPFPDSWPPWLKNAVAQLSVNPVMSGIPTGSFRGIPGEDAAVQMIEPELKSIGKRVSDLLGTTFERAPGTGSSVPQRMNLSNFDARSGDIQLTGQTKTAPQMNVAPQDLDKLLSSGKMDIQQPPAGATDAIRKKLLALLP